METHRRNATVVLLGVALCLCGGPAGWSADQKSGPSQVAPSDDPPEGVEVLGAGPVHEAFAQPGSNQARPGPVVTKQPPRPLTEQIPSQEPDADDLEWISGYWSWDEDRSDFIWVTGIWRLPPPDQQWVPGFWAKVEGGWQWASGYWTAANAGEEQEQEVAFVPQPPAPREEEPPPAPAQNSTYIPGSWAYENNGYAWQSGYWVGNRPGWLWIPGYYLWSPRGYSYVNGYWDYDPARRGLLFAPIFVDRRIWQRPGWSYSPRFFINNLALLDSLFVRSVTRNYYFGNYYDARYRRFGFVPWADYRIGRHAWDPWFAFARWNHRNDPRWERDLRALTKDRLARPDQRPPRNLAEQRDWLRDHRAGLTARSALVGSLAHAGDLGLKLRNVSREQRLREQRNSAQLRNVRAERSRLEARVGGKPGSLPATLHMKLPHAGSVVKGDGKFKPPARPVPAQNLVAKLDKRDTSNKPGGSADKDKNKKPGGQGPNRPGNNKAGGNKAVAKAQPHHHPAKPGAPVHHNVAAANKKPTDHRAHPAAPAHHAQGHAAGKPAHQHPAAKPHAQPLHSAPKKPAPKPRPSHSSGGGHKKK
jgi:hypothetical protein